VRGEAAWRTIFLYPLAVSFIVTGTVWSWLYNPVDGNPGAGARIGLDELQFRPRQRPTLCDLRGDHHRPSGRRRALPWRSSWLVCARLDSDLSQGRTDRRRIDLPHLSQSASCQRLRRSSWRSAVIQIQFAIQEPSTWLAALTKGGPGISTTFPAIYVYDLMFQRGQIGEGAAAAIMMLAALAVVLVPYSLWVVWRRRKEAGHG